MASSAARRGLWRAMRARYSWSASAESSSVASWADGVSFGMRMLERIVVRGVMVCVEGWWAVKGGRVVSAAGGGGGLGVRDGVGSEDGVGVWKSWESQVRERVSMCLEAQRRRSNPFFPWSMEGARRLSEISRWRC